MKNKFIISILIVVTVFMTTACSKPTTQGTADYTNTESAEQTNALYGKTAVFLGDSICAGTTVDENATEYGYGWGGMIGEANNMNWDNEGRNGAVVAEIEGQTRIVADQIDLAVEKYSSVDYVIFEGGANDADLLHGDSSAFGVISDDFSTFNKTTFTGAFESLISEIKTAFPNAKVGYVIPPKMGQGPYDADNNFRRVYFERAIEVCEKWDIEYLDLWNDSPLNPDLSEYYDGSLDNDGNTEAGKYYVDGQHLTLKGYQGIVPDIESFMLSL